MSLSIVAAQAVKAEGQSGVTRLTFTVIRSDQDAAQAMTLAWSVEGAGSSPADAADFLNGVLPSGTLSFAAGQTSRIITVNVIADRSIEADEQFSVVIANPSTGTPIAVASATGTILNDDAGFAIAAPAAAKKEGQPGSTTALAFTVTRSGDTSVAHSVDWAVAGPKNRPADAADFVGGVLPAGTLLFAPGEVSKVITIPVAGDSVVEAPEAFTVTLANPSTGARLLTASATGQILNDDAAFAIADANALRAEGAGGTTPFTFTVTRSGDLTTTHSVQWSVSGNGKAAATGADFAGGVLPSGTLTFAPGEVNKTITLDVLADRLAEAAEGFAVSLSAPSAGAVLSTAATAFGTILDGTTPVPAPGGTLTGAQELAWIASTYAATVDSSGAPWGVTVLPDDVLRFEVRSGDTWAGYDIGRGVERTEISQDGRTWKVGTPVEIHYRMMIEPGAPNTASSFIIMQMHTADGRLPDGSYLGPNMTLNLVGERMSVAINTSPDRLNAPTTSKTFLLDAPEIVRGQWYDIRAEVLLDAAQGYGFVRLWRDGVQLLDYNGPVGRGGDTGGYFKQGLYRTAASETVAMQVADLTVQGIAKDITATDGNDVFEVYNPADRIIGPQGGIDTVRTNLLQYALPDGVEKLVFLPGAKAAFTGTGNALDNTIDGGNLDDRLLGGGGKDMLRGLDGNDTLEGGAGDDTLVAGTGSDMLIGGDGNDSLVAGTGPDVLIGGDGNDTLVAGTGSDVLIGDAGNDVYVYDADAPTIIEQAGGGIDTIRTPRYVAALPDEIENLVVTGMQVSGNGNALDNTISGNAANNVLAGLAGADTLLGKEGDDVLRGGDGSDRLFGGAGADTLDGGLDDDRLYGEVGADLLRGGDGNDTLVGGEEADTLEGGLANDRLNGDVGADLLRGGDGNDTLFGGEGADTLEGGLDNDRLYGEVGADLLRGGDGNDTLVGGEGADTLEGGNGDDRAMFRPEDLVAGESFNGGAGIDTADFHSFRVGDITAITLVSVERLQLRGTVTLTQAQFAQATQFDGKGNAFSLVASTTGLFDLGARTLSEGFQGLLGSTGADTIIGGATAARLAGGGGADLLVAGTAAEVLNGGEGADVFRFVAGRAAGDVIEDFAGLGPAAGDRLVFQGYGTPAQGAKFLALGGGQWQIVSANGQPAETITLLGAPEIHASDYVFL